MILLHEKYNNQLYGAWLLDTSYSFYLWYFILNVHPEAVGMNFFFLELLRMQILGVCCKLVEKRSLDNTVL